MSAVEPGTILAGKYRVIGTLGRGGMGVVLEARHDELDQHVAIKLMAAHAAQNADWAARFAREARLAARIKSEHVVRVFDVGKLDTGQPYMVMEFLDGEDVQALLDRARRLPIPTAVEYVLQAGEALAEAHAAGIIHRDLKPANLFLTTRADGSAFVKVLDFGISKVTNDIQGVAVTNTSAIVGSPLYMSPEQMKASKNVDARTDVWSLGVILQQLVTGAPPFDAETAPELCALVLTSPPSRMIDTLPTTPSALQDVVSRCLEKDPLRRFASVAELARALEPFAEGTAKLSIERITRVLARAPTAGPAITDPMPAQHHRDAQRVSIGDATDVNAISDTLASDPLPAVSSGPVTAPQGPTLVSAGNARPAEVAATQAQAPLDVAPAPPPPRAEPAGVASTAAAWGGPPQRAEPHRSPWPLIGAGIALLGIGAVVLFVLSRGGGEPANPATPTSATATVTTAASLPSAAAQGARADSGAAPVDVQSLPKATAGTNATHTAPRASAAIKPPIAKPSATATTKPTANDTSEFGGRK